MPDRTACTWTSPSPAPTATRGSSGWIFVRAVRWQQMIKAKQLPAIISAFPLAIGVTQSLAHSRVYLDTPQVSGHV